MSYVSEEAIRRLIHYTGHCCDSCHDDAEYYADAGMYQLREIELGRDRCAEVCCAVGNAYDEWFRLRAYDATFSAPASSGEK